MIPVRVLGSWSLQVGEVGAFTWRILDLPQGDSEFISSLIYSSLGKYHSWLFKRQLLDWVLVLEQASSPPPHPRVLSSDPFCHMLYLFDFSARVWNTPVAHSCQGYWYGDSKEACSLTHGWEPMLSLFAIMERSTSSRQVVFCVHTINAYFGVILGYLCSRMTIYFPLALPIYMLSGFNKSWPFHPEKTRLFYISFGTQLEAEPSRTIWPECLDPMFSAL